MLADLRPGTPVRHERYGAGVVVAVDDGYARVFFTSGEQTVPVAALGQRSTWEQRVVAGIRPGNPEAYRRLQAALEATDLPLHAEAALTAAKVDLLPHQIVLTHRVATALPRRFLIADDVGLGKTIETALVLRELASRGEMQRALIVVPAGLVENWRRELNEVFNLDFEVLGSEGDVTDRRTNAFERHHRLIVSIDTLKRPQRMERLAAAAPWDLVVFDEAHHLTALRMGTRVKRTDNYRLAEQLRDHSRDLLLLSATPHQGDHFRFLSLIRLLNQDLFRDERDMLENRHRLNTVVIRRTKADACKPDGSPLFTRRQVHTQHFALAPEERCFYEALTEYIEAGYDLAAQRGGKSRALGFVMTIFQKIAASSFLAVRRTLERRLLSLTIHEAVVRDAEFDVAGRDALLLEARALIAEMHDVDEESMMGRAKIDQWLLDARVRVLKRIRAADDEEIDDSEIAASAAEESIALLVNFALPEERARIRELLALFPAGMESKSTQLLEAMEELWTQNPAEKMIVFTTYLGSVDGLRQAIESHFPHKGVEVLKGGDQSAKIAAERRFRRPDGPRVLISTAAGREGINLQFARILFNHDLPWNPMDVEQRIGRIHRYGQVDTVQVYNLVSRDTIEGKVFLLLEAKIAEIARALGKVDDRGQVAEDMRSQILGQLGERLSFNRLYQEALKDPSLKRTDQEVEIALRNANLARDIVGQLFQDLDPFRLDDYRPSGDQRALERLGKFVEGMVARRNGAFVRINETYFDVRLPGRESVHFTTVRDEALADEKLQLLGIDHPLVEELLVEAKQLEPEERALLVAELPDADVRSVWEVTIGDTKGRSTRRLYELMVRGQTVTSCRPYGGDWPSEGTGVAKKAPARDRARLVDQVMATALRAALAERGELPQGASYRAQLLGWLEAA